MWRVLAVLCLCAGCAGARVTWKTTSPGAIPDGSHVLVVTGDRAVELGSAHVRGGELGGTMLRTWRLPELETAVPPSDGAAPDELARRAGWTPVPAQGPSTFELEEVRRVELEVVERESRHDPLEIAGGIVVIAVLVVAAAVFAPHVH